MADESTRLAVAAERNSRRPAAGRNGLGPCPEHVDLTGGRVECADAAAAVHVPAEQQLTRREPGERAGGCLQVRGEAARSAPVGWEGVNIAADHALVAHQP